jgi:hypothetical protein
MDPGKLGTFDDLEVIYDSGKISREISHPRMSTVVFIAFLVDVEMFHLPAPMVKPKEAGAPN